ELTLVACASVLFTPVPLLPSPKVQAYVRASPSGSDEPLPSKLTAAPSAPEYGPPGAAVGVRFTAPGASWHEPLPASVKVWPAMGMNFQSYPVEHSVRFRPARVLD